MSEERSKEDVIAECDKAYIVKRSLPDIDGIPLVEDSPKENIAILPFLGFPVEEVTELDWHTREKEQKAIYNDLMAEAEALEKAEYAAWRTRMDNLKMKPINDAKDYLAGCTDEKDAESCAYWKAKREDLLATNFNTRITDVDLGDKVARPSMARDEWINQMKNALGPSFQEALEAEAEDWRDLAEGKIKITEHREKVYWLNEEINHLKITNRVLTILLIFSTAFGIAAALAWLRCQ